MMPTTLKPHRRIAALLALLTAGCLALVAPPGAQTLPTGLEPEAVAANTCRFCGLVNKSGHYFCTRCARLFRAEASDTASRFWGDAFYVIHYPPLNEKPHLQSDCADGKLRSEKTHFDAGDLYRVAVGKKGTLQIEGKIRAWTSAGTVDFKAEAIDTVDAGGRLTRREVHAIVKDNPTRHLYRRIEYQYAGEQLRGFAVSNWLYRDANDWKDKPAEWVRHDTSRVDFTYTDGLLARISTSSREVTHGLRGQVEYGEPRAMTQTVEVAQGIVSRVEDAHP